jgi:ketosteroid isomerase-like protein
MRLPQPPNRNGESRDERRRRNECSFDPGYVQEYVVHGTLTSGGEAFRMPLCRTVTVRDGRIARLDEYLDSAHLKPLQTA